MKRILFGSLLILSLASCAGFNGAGSEFNYGLASFNQGRYEEAIPYFRRATEVDPNYARAYLFLGRSYLNLGRYLEAVPPLRTALELSPQESKGQVQNVLLDALSGGRVLQPRNNSEFSPITQLLR